MRIAMEQIDQTANSPSRLAVREMDALEVERLVENLREGGCSILLEWAKREAPELLKQLMASYVSRHSSASTVRSVHSESTVSSQEAAKRMAEATTLEAAEREHIQRVLSESKNLTQAAAILGIHSTTLWRKRKLYHLE